MSNAGGTLVLDGPAQKEAQERIDQIDFKMVTFSLGGKDYGIDIMKVKEIAKFNSFTYVPNSSPYVRGVYNLRGDIISILDLRILFHLPAGKTESDGDTENGLILRLDENVIGVVVDSIDKVIGISSEDIQPPHPIFGDINIKYISGVVENEGRLYIILNAERICAKEEPVRKTDSRLPSETVGNASGGSVPAPVYTDLNASEPEQDFIRDTLRTFKNFYVTPVNETWFSERFMEWKDLRRRQGTELQLKSAEDADEYLKTFPSVDTGKFWSDNTAAIYSRFLGDTSGKIISVWNIGCGKGFESYSFTALLTRKYPGLMIKVWANDNDLLAISTAPNLVFTDEDIPEYLGSYVSTGKNGSSFQTDFKNRIFFEYHDALHSNAVPELDYILARDVLSFFSQEDQMKVFHEFHEKLKPTGVLILGDNEKPLDSSLWTAVANSKSAYKKS
jgi:purine-binding chemotaxis protein CheW